MSPLLASACAGLKAKEKLDSFAKQRVIKNNYSFCMSEAKGVSGKNVNRLLLVY